MSLLSVISMYPETMGVKIKSDRSNVGSECINGAYISNSVYIHSSLYNISIIYCVGLSHFVICPV